MKNYCLPLFKRLNKPVMKLNFVFIMIVLLGTSCNKAIESPSEHTTSKIDSQEVIPSVQSNKIVAHRGAWKEFGLPDNSFAAFEKAIDLELFGSECDIQITKDDQVIVYHDEKIGGKYIKDLNYTTDIKDKFTLKNGENIPLLTSFLNRLVGTDTTFSLWMDIKSLSDLAGGNNQSIKAGQAATSLVNQMTLQAKVKFIVGRKAVLDPVLLAVADKWDVAYMNTAYTSDQFIKAKYKWANYDYKFFYTSGQGNQSLWDSYVDKDIKVSVYTVDDQSAVQWFLNQPKTYAISTNLPQTMLNL